MLWSLKAGGVCEMAGRYVHGGRKYVPALDGLRTIAVSLVILGHLSYGIFPRGDIGVDIFFALSALGKCWPVAALGLAAIVGFGNRSGAGWDAASFLITAVIAAIFITEICQNPSSIFARALATRYLVRLGVISYGVYLWHYALLVQVAYWIPNSFATARQRLSAVRSAAAVNPRRYLPAFFGYSVS